MPEKEGEGGGGERDTPEWGEDHTIKSRRQKKKKKEVNRRKGGGRYTRRRTRRNHVRTGKRPRKNYKKMQDRKKSQK